MLVPLFALQPARGRRSDRRSDPACLAGASPQDHGWEACGGEAVHEPRRHHSELIESADKGDLNTCNDRKSSMEFQGKAQGGNVMTKDLMRSVCSAGLLAASE